MQIVEIVNSTVHFETDTATGTCEYCITDLHDDWDVKISKIQAIDDNTDLEYILTDEEERAIYDEVWDYVAENIIDDLLDPEFYQDEDDWRYNE